MAISNSGEVWAARVADNFRKQSIYRNLVDDVSSQVSSRAKELNFTDLESSVVNIRDYTPGTALTDAHDQPTDAETSLTLDKNKAVRIFVDRVQARQHGAADIVDSFSRQAARKLAEQVDSDIKTALIKAGDFSATHKNLQTTPNFSDTSTDGFTDALIDDLTEAIEKADNLNWPQENRRIIFGPAVKRILSKHILSEGVVEGNTIQGFSGRIGRLLGMTAFLDSGMETPDAQNDVVAVMVNPESVKFALQFDDVEIDSNMANSNGLFGTGVAMLGVYGVKKIFLDQSIMIRAAA